MEQKFAKKYIEKIMTERGFVEVSRAMQDDEAIAIDFVYQPPEKNKTQRFPVPSYGCRVSVNGEFQLRYVAPHSINVLSTPTCSPFDNEEHFNNICMKFESQASILEKYCNI